MSKWSDYNPPESAGRYLKFKAGETRVRILSDPLAFYVRWTTDSKPVRSLAADEWPEGVRFKPGADGRARHAVAFAVWDYSDSTIKVCEVTQVTIQKALHALAQNPKWGDPTAYDLAINRVGSGLSDTEYSVVPEPPSAIPPAVSEAYLDAMDAGLDLRRLLSGGDPFSGEPVTTDDDIPF